MLFLCKEKERNYLCTTVSDLHVQMRISICYLSVISIKYGLQTADRV